MCFDTDHTLPIWAAFSPGTNFRGNAVSGPDEIVVLDFRTESMDLGHLTNGDKTVVSGGHALASAMILGGELEQIQFLLGHVSVQMTKKPRM